MAYSGDECGRDCGGDEVSEGDRGRIEPITKEAFISQYIAAFLGAHAANMYYDGKRPDWQRTIVQNPPVEDAVFQAEETWKRCCEHKPEYFAWRWESGEYV